MPNHQQFSPTYNNYVPAILCHQKDNWQIEYYVFSPVTNQMERKRMRLNKLRRHCGTLKEFKAHAANIVQTINNQLAGGWSPFGESENIRYYTTLDEVMRLYIEEKEKELKKDTMRSYKSFCKIFGEWCLKTVPGCKCIQFNRVLAIRYMDYVYNERKVSARSYNNQLKMARAFFSWAVEKCYCKENPFEMLRVKKEAEKKRIIIDADTRRRIRDYFERENPGFIVVMELIYTSFLLLFGGFSGSLAVFLFLSFSLLIGFAGCIFSNRFLFILLFDNNIFSLLKTFVIDIISLINSLLQFCEFFRFVPHERVLH